MDSAGILDPNGEGKGCCHLGTCCPSGFVQGVCPAGWHLPTQRKWDVLFSAVGGTSVAGTNLKSTNGWGSDGNGTDEFGYSSENVYMFYYDTALAMTSYPSSLKAHEVGDLRGRRPTSLLLS